MSYFPIKWCSWKETWTFFWCSSHNDDSNRCCFMCPHLILTECHSQFCTVKLLFHIVFVTKDFSLSPHVFGCTCFVKDLFHGLDKLSACSLICVSVGYSTFRKAIGIIILCYFLTDACFFSLFFVINWLLSISLLPISLPIPLLMTSTGNDKVPQPPSLYVYSCRLKITTLVFCMSNP